MKSFLRSIFHREKLHSFLSSHLDEAEADPLFGQVGVEWDIRLRLNHGFILINGLLIPNCRQM